jgi:hypothetical protein
MVHARVLEEGPRSYVHVQKRGKQSFAGLAFRKSFPLAHVYFTATSPGISKFQNDHIQNMSVTRPAKPSLQGRWVRCVHAPATLAWDVLDEGDARYEALSSEAVLTWHANAILAIRQVGIFIPLDGCGTHRDVNVADQKDDSLPTAAIRPTSQRVHEKSRRVAHCIEHIRKIMGPGSDWQLFLPQFPGLYRFDHHGCGQRPCLD